VSEAIPGLEMIRRLWATGDRIVGNVLLDAAIILLLQVVHGRGRR
jgi:hypothetical protein